MVIFVHSPKIFVFNHLWHELICIKIPIYSIQREREHPLRFGFMRIHEAPKRTRIKKLKSHKVIISILHGAIVRFLFRHRIDHIKYMNFFIIF